MRAGSFFPCCHHNFSAGFGVLQEAHSPGAWPDADPRWTTTSSAGQGRVKASSSTTPRSFPSQGCGNNAAIRLYLPFAPGSFMTYSSPLMTTAASFQSRAPSPEARALPSPPPPLKPHHLQLKATTRRRLQARLPSPLCALHQIFGTISQRGRGHGSGLLDQDGSREKKKTLQRERSKLQSVTLLRSPQAGSSASSLQPQPHQMREGR